MAVTRNFDTDGTRALYTGRWHGNVAGGSRVAQVLYQGYQRAARDRAERIAVSAQRAEFAPPCVFALAKVTESVSTVVCTFY